MTVTIRRGTAADAAAGAELYLRARRAALGAIPPLAHDAEDVRGWFASHVVQRLELWVAEDEAGELAGLLVLEDDWLDQLYVDPGRTGQGIGTQLLEVARRERPGGLRLWTFQSNAGAQRFYERRGFTEVLRTDGSENEERSPDILFSDQPPAVIEVEAQERYWYPDAGGEVWLAGFQLVDAETGGFLARDAPELRARGLRVSGVAGAAIHHAEALASGEAAPGRPLVLRRDRVNPHDPNAIAVHTAVGAQLGWVPRELAAELATELDAPRPWSAVVLREQRPSPRDPRTGVTMLLAAAPVIRLIVQG